MDQIFILTAVVAVLVLTSVGGVIYVLFGARLSRSDRLAQRISFVAGSELKTSANRGGGADVQRRRQVQNRLKELDILDKNRNSGKVSMAMRLERASINLSVRGFYGLSLGFGVLCAGLMWLSGAPLLIVFLTFFVSSLGVPRWVLRFLSVRRQRKFLEEFSNAIDVIVRGVKAGLPLNDCLSVVARENAEPVASEFRELVENMALGVTLERSLERIYRRMPLPEVNFFIIVLTMQKATGGNLSEALGNLSSVLRDRKQMRGKIRAMSQEARSSAAIIGSLPPGVMLLVYLTTPDYMDTLFTTTMGNVLIVVSILWMSLGIFVMRKMINFKF